MLSQDSFLFSEVFTFEFGLTPQFTPVSERPRVFLCFIARYGASCLPRDYEIREVRRLPTSPDGRPVHMRLYTASLLLTTASAFQITQNIPLIHHHRTACDSTAPRMVADFSGEWEMDLDSSDSLGPLLRALGLNRLLAAVITRLAAKQSISQSSDMLTVEVTTRLSSTLKMPSARQCSRLASPAARRHT